MNLTKLILSGVDPDEIEFDDYDTAPDRPERDIARTRMKSGRNYDRRKREVPQEDC